MLVQERMTRDAIAIKRDVPVDKALRMMQDKKIHRLPVVDEAGRLVGIVSHVDLLYASPSPATSLTIYETHYLPLGQGDLQGLCRSASAWHYFPPCGTER